MKNIRRTDCLNCKAPLPKPILEFRNMPASAQDLPTKDTLFSDSPIDLFLCQCDRCGLVQFDCTAVGYYKDVIRSGGYSSTLAEIRRKEFSHLIGCYGLKDKRILEVGCGAGEFLTILEEYPVFAFGIEHADHLVKQAKERGLHVERGYTETTTTPLRALFDGKPFDAFLSFNYLEHQPDPRTMLTCIFNNLNDGGIGLITVPSLEYMMQNGSYYEFMRDHIVYYSFASLRHLLNECGFSVIEEEVLNHDTISVVVKKTGVEKIANCAPLVFEGLSFDRLANSFQVIGNRVDALLTDLSRRNKTFALWGASHQAFTLASTTPLGKMAKYVIDSAPFKQHKYTPVFHKEIIAPDEFCKRPVDAILIIAPGFYKEIAKTITENYCKKQGFDLEIYALFDDEIKVIQK